MGSSVMFQNLCMKLRTLSKIVDLTALLKSHQLTKYVACKANSYSKMIDEMSKSCHKDHYYAFSSFFSITCVLGKIQQDQIPTNPKTPYRETQFLYPQVLGMLVKKLFLIPSSKWLLLDPTRRPHLLLLCKTLMWQ